MERVKIRVHELKVFDVFEIDNAIRYVYKIEDGRVWTMSAHKNANGGIYFGVHNEATFGALSQRLIYLRPDIRHETGHIGRPLKPFSQLSASYKRTQKAHIKKLREKRGIKLTF